MQKLAEICIRRPVFATMLIMALVVVGGFCYTRLGVDLFPKVDFPTVTVTTVLPGASPEEVETEVTKKVEEAVNTISGIDELRSASSEGISQVFVTFILERDGDEAAQDVRDRVGRILGNLPREIDPPVIEKIDPDAQPVVSIAVSGNSPAREITEIADKQIKQQIESLNGVGQVRFIGDRKREIQVWLNPEKLMSYGLTIDEVRRSLAAQNIEIPGGRVDAGIQELTLRTLGRVKKVEEFNEIVLKVVNGSPVHVADIGTVEDGIEEPRSLARVDGKEAIVLEVRKQSGTNTLAVVEGVKERLAEIKPLLPAGLQIRIVRDQSVYIRSSFESVQEHLVLGGFFAALVVLLFIGNWRATLIAAIAIPTSIISTYTLMWAMGFTLNNMTMLALTLCVGIVIDDAVVVLENIFRFIEEKGVEPMLAARDATADIGLAVMATTLSLVIIFLPVAFMGGIVGRFMSSFGFTSAFSIMISLLVSFTLTPMLCARFLKAKADEVGHKKSAKSSRFYTWFDRSYMAMLVWSMKHRLAMSLIALGTIVAIVPMFMLTGKDFIPQDDQSQFEVNVRAPEGTSLLGSSALVSQLEGELKALPGVEFVLSTVGADSQQRVNFITLFMQLVPLHERKETQQMIMQQARRLMAKYSNDLRVAVQYPAAISGGGVANADLLYTVRGPDLQKLTEYSEKISQVVKQIPGVVDVDSSLEVGKPELRAHINRAKAADLGISVQDIASSLRTMVAGEEVSSFQEGDDRYEVRLRVAAEDRRSAETVGRLYIPSARGGNVQLSSVVTLDEGVGPAQIQRYNRQRQVTISGNIEKGHALSEVLARLEPEVQRLDMGPAYQTGLLGRSRELGRAGSAFVVAFLLSFTFMYMILAAQFESFLHPITILLSLPMAIPFALVSLLVFSQTLNVFSSLGILMLFGVVKKNSILQIDHMNNLRHDHGMARYDAILQACRDRLRPILMTTFALVAGMLPMALGTGVGSGVRRSVAIIVIGGQMLCLLLTLLAIPVAYSLFDDLATSPLWGRLASAWDAVVGRFRRKLAGAVSSLFG